MGWIDIARPDAPGYDELVPSRYALKVGDIDVMIISDGVLPIAPATLATNAASADLSAWLGDMFLSPEMLDWPLNVAVVPAGNRVAPPGFGLSHVIGTALDHGRFTVAWGCVGMAGACLDEAADHVLTRRQNGVALAEHELVRAKIAEMHLAAASARALAERAARLRDDRAPDAASATFAAKYAAARAAASVSRDAVQLQGAAGCAPDSLAQRFFRDAKVMQIIEGADEVALLRVAEHVLGGRRARTAPGRNPAGDGAAR
ncbi:acyl-CoA dehydrogenase family protein [Streptomyces eurythermus]